MRFGGWLGLGILALGLFLFVTSRVEPPVGTSRPSTEGATRTRILSSGDEPSRTHSSAALAEIPADLTYEVISADTLLHERRSLDVRLSRPVAVGVLEALALELRNSGP